MSAIFSWETSGSAQTHSVPRKQENAGINRSNSVELGYMNEEKAKECTNNAIYNQEERRLPDWW